MLLQLLQRWLAIVLSESCSLHARLLMLAAVRTKEHVLCYRLEAWVKPPTGGSASSCR